MLPPTQRFSSRVENYVRYRPGYHAELIALLRRDCGLTADSVVADIGPGTGKLTALLRQSGCAVFDVEPNQGFARILKPGGQVVLIWNDRRTDSTPFLSAYENLLREIATDYAQVNHRNIDLNLLRQFFGREPKFAKFPYSQRFNSDGLCGRLLSSSYAPDKGQPKHEEMLARLRQIFDENQNAGEVTFDYDTLVYHGRLS